LRREYGVNAPGWATNRWTPEVLARLGREPDTVIARELGVTTASVLSKRRTLGIPALLDDPEVQVARPDEPGLLTAPGSTS
jgi:hypothetical protein